MTDVREPGSGPFIRTARLVLRPWTEADVDDLVAEADDPRVAASLRDRFPSPYTRADAREWIALASADPLKSLAITREGKPIGGIGLMLDEDVYRFTGEVGYWLGVAHWGQGLATEAVRAFCDHVFAATDLRRLHARVFAGNPASGRVLVNAGFALEGVARQVAFKAERFLDVEWYGRLRA